MSDVTAIKISDVATIRAAGIDPGEVAHAFARSMFEQLFLRGYFHGDPHPGNIFVTPGRDGAFVLTFVDFGMMGTVSDQLRRGLRRVMIAAAARDGRGLVAAMADVGVLLPGADTRELERAMTALFARFGGMGFGELINVDEREFRDFAVEFGEVMRELPFQLPENFLLILRAMTLTSGVASALEPTFNVWEAVEPFAERLVQEESGSTARDRGARGRRSPDDVGAPGRIDAVIDRIEDGSVQVDLSRLERRVARVEGLARRMVSVILFGILLIAGVLVYASAPPLGIVLMSLSALPLAHVVFAGFRAPPR